jgi:FKBP-type peptidyl-prolyl cis-trans isomerase
MNFKSARPWIAGGAILLLIIAAGAYWYCHRKPASLKERVSYTIGSQFGKSLQAQNLDLNDRMVMRGLIDGINGRQNQLSEEEMQAAMVQLNQQRQKALDDVAAKNKEEAESFLSRNRAYSDVKVTPSGLQYKMVTEGRGPSPTINDNVVVNFKASLTDGTEFDSSYKRGTPVEFPVKGVMPGWSEGLRMMKKGGKAVFYVPPSLGYGDRPRQNIPANSVVIFDVELVDIRPGHTGHKK